MNDTTLYIRPVTLPERSYTYSQSQQISMQTGFIGYLRADMDSNGEGFSPHGTIFAKTSRRRRSRMNLTRLSTGFGTRVISCITARRFQNTAILIPKPLLEKTA